jgi:hypothetical protein
VKTQTKKATPFQSETAETNTPKASRNLRFLQRLCQRRLLERYNPEKRIFHITSAVNKGSSWNVLFTTFIDIAYMSNPYFPANLYQKWASHATRIRRRNLNPEMWRGNPTWGTHVCEECRLIWKLPEFTFLGSTFIRDTTLKKYTHNIDKIYKPHFLICLFFIHLSTTVVIWLWATSDKR